MSGRLVILSTELFTITSAKATTQTYTIKDTLGEPVQGTFYEQECTGNVPHRTSTQEGEKSTVCEMKNLQQRVQIMDTTNRS